MILNLPLAPSQPAPSAPLPDRPLPELLAALEAWMRDFPSVLVAYSGGVDSSLLMAIAHRVLGKHALACIGKSPSYPERELAAAVDLANEVGAQVRIVNTEEHLDPRYAANPSNRCYFCKSELYDRLKRLALEEGFAIIVDGNNASDVAADRPGWLAGRERGIRSPLAELGISKEAVRALAKELGLPIWNKPAMPCLSSRVPHGTPIVPSLLKQIEQAEAALAGMGFREFRVRHHGNLARLELAPADFPRALELREKITDALQAAGYQFVTLDLTGYQSGSLHRATR